MKVLEVLSAQVARSPAVRGSVQNRFSVSPAEETPSCNLRGHIPWVRPIWDVLGYTGWGSPPQAPVLLALGPGGRGGGHRGAALRSPPQELFWSGKTAFGSQQREDLLLVPRVAWRGPNGGLTRHGPAWRPCVALRGTLAAGTWFQGALLP